MKEEFATYEQALALKELGFDEPTFADYYVFGDGELRNGKYGQTEPMLFINDLGLAEKCDELGMFCYHDVSVPLKSQVFRWFREKHNLFTSITRYKNSSVKEDPNLFPKVYDIYIQDENIDESIWVGEFDTYEEAEDACINELIKLIKKQQQ